jgi:hypothetical protein
MKWPSVALAGACALLLSACGRPSADGSTTNTALNMIMFQSARPPTVTNPLPTDDEQAELDCPPVTIREGGAAMRAFGGGATSDSLRNQLSITNVARECAAAGGGLTIKVGVEGRALVGPAGSAGPQQATLRTVVRRGTAIVAQRAARVGATIPTGEMGANFMHIESGIAVPPGPGDIEIEVGLESGGAAPRSSRR